MGTSVIAVPAAPPEAAIIQMVMAGWISKIITDTSRLGVPDAVKAHGPLTTAEMVARGIPANAASLERALRVTAALGIYTEDEAGRFGPTELSDVMTAGSPVSVKKLVDVFGGTWADIFVGLIDAIKTGKPQALPRLGLDFWDYLKANPREMEDFGEAMKANSIASQMGVVAKVDFSASKRVVDVGGGFGHLAVALLEKYPALTATVIDMPALIPIARLRFPVKDPAVASRITYVGADMFEGVPEADTYLLKHIIHDWEDEKCVRLLEHCRRSMQGDGRVIAVDAILPPMGNTEAMPSKVMDVAMMVFITGKERTLAQWEDLYHAAGLRIAKVTQFAANWEMNAIEGVKA
ncbi:MAG TPA: methyltransferase [Bryobacteraceae bacterium]|jgi:ubiquinone/menaquinone biosynthesis C-methylase UbiE